MRGAIARGANVEGIRAQGQGGGHCESAAVPAERPNRPSM